jgi:hypothetical protein
MERTPDVEEDIPVSYSMVFSGRCMYTRVRAFLEKNHGVRDEVVMGAYWFHRYAMN